MCSVKFMFRATAVYNNPAGSFCRDFENGISR